MRCAVGIFDTWDSVQTSIADLMSGGTADKNCHCLGLRRVFAPLAGHTSGHRASPLADLHFSGNAELISCTAGAVAERLATRLNRGAPTLKAALGHWLIPRHAAHLEGAVLAGKINLWVQLFDNDEERRAYQSLLARSSTTVGVHDLIGE
jgi:hypothetical protein